MKLYTANLSVYCAKVRMQIHAKGVSDIEFETPESFMRGEFAKVSPIGRIPALDLGDRIIPESGVIMEYLEEIYPEPSLLGETPEDRANVRLLCRLSDTYLADNLFQALPQARPETRNEAIRDMHMAEVNRGMIALERHLAEGQFAAGDKLTLADCALVPTLLFAGIAASMLDVGNPVDACPKVAAYFSGIKEHKSAARVLKEMTEAFGR